MPETGAAFLCGIAGSPTSGPTATPQLSLELNQQVGAGSPAYYYRRRQRQKAIDLITGYTCAAETEEDGKDGRAGETGKRTGPWSQNMAALSSQRALAA